MSRKKTRASRKKQIKNKSMAKKVDAIKVVLKFSALFVPVLSIIASVLGLILLSVKSMFYTIAWTLHSDLTFNLDVEKNEFDLCFNENEIYRKCIKIDNNANGVISYKTYRQKKL